MTDDVTLEKLLKSRYSCRGFLPELVPTDTIERMFVLAQRTASWCNSQAWSVHVTSGEDTARFAKGLTEWAATNAPASDIPSPERYEGVYQERRRAAGFGLYNAVGIGRDDYEGRI